MRTARISVAGTPGVLIAAGVGRDDLLSVGNRMIPRQGARFEPACDGLVYGVALNDATSLRALGDAVNQAPYKAPPRAPVLYIKPYNTHQGHEALVRLPKGADRVEVFGALGVVFGAQATRVGEAGATQTVRGYTVVADLSLPQASLFRPPIREKCFDGACPIGPWIVDRDEVGDPAALEVLVFVNGELRQRRALRDLIRPVPRLIADVSAFLTLYPGDVLLAGVPLEAPSAAPGDRIAVEIPGVGRLENPIEATA